MTPRAPGRAQDDLPLLLLLAHRSCMPGSHGGPPAVARVEVSVPAGLEVNLTCAVRDIGHVGASTWRPSTSTPAACYVGGEVGSSWSPNGHHGP
eukprot:3892416-Pyramimonas_sp.AAC.1